MAAKGTIFVVNIPDPQPGASNRDVVIPAIPDDIVREISNFLNFSDRLSLALTSRHVHSVVQTRLQEVVVEAPRLAALQGWICENPGVRGLQLRVLHFVTPPESWSWFYRDRYGPAVQSCFDIMGRAPNLEDLSCAPFLSLALDSKHLRAFAGLKSLHLSGCTTEMLASLRLPETLIQLHLSDSLAGTVLPFRRILRSIHRLPALTTLVLERLSLPDDPEDDAEDDDDINEDALANEIADEDADAQNSEDGDEDDDDETGGNQRDAGLLIISSVRTLRTLEQELPPYLSLATTFPRLQNLVLDGSTHLNADVGDKGTLQHLSVSGSFNGEPVRWRVNHLTYVSGFTTHDGLVLDNACDPAHLVSLALQLVFVSYIVWDEILAQATNIRFLEIESLESPFPDYIYLFSKLFKPDAPVNFPLLCLSILAPAGPNHAPEDIEKNREAFLNRACQYLPSLRYIALAESPESTTLPCKDDYSGVAAPWRWWHVVRDEDGSPIEIREIPGWEGERVRRYLRNADREGADHFDDHFVALR
ncbi:hypothetical protein L227DRAFT_607371 [Lentinus tigrinus ALCF2SS1-6]|uniref:F-box domain-containing protein n=1 Tax=Lentinus tigrinus ALCF2SS1-6 TaxID=1328759 RepID=A0A5C2SLN5_9APHY|nr:hypothetical protein L227DRAFT_607371 [Lentinus tigrinus ALCF2SS1-6]